MKSLAHQNLTELGGATSVLARQKRDHIYLDQLLNELEDLPPQQQQPVLLKMYGLVFPHAFAEEAVLWPVIRKVLPDGHELTLKVELEHQEINELVVRFEALDTFSPERPQVLERIINLLRTDVRDEEDELLPRLQTQLTPLELQRLGTTWELVRKIAPTRAHAIVSRRPPGNVLSALPLSLIDRGRDFADTLLYRGAGAFNPPLRALSLGLREASHLVERLPGMKRGEDPATRVDPRFLGGLGGKIVAALAVSVVFLIAKRRHHAA